MYVFDLRKIGNIRNRKYVDYNIIKYTHAHTDVSKLSLEL